MKKRLKKRVGKISVPVGVMSHFHMEADRAGGGIALSFGGVKNVLDYSSTYVKLACGFVSISVEGTALAITLYENKTVEISGKVEGIDFSYAKN